MSNKITKQQKVYSNGVHVGTYNYNSSGKMVSRDWADSSGNWSKHGAIDPSTLKNHTTGATRSVASTSARNPVGGGGAGSTSRGSNTYNPYSGSNTSSYVRDDDPSSGIANPYGGGAANNFGNGPITQEQAEAGVQRWKDNTYQTQYGPQVIFEGADQEAMFNYFGVNRGDGGTRAGGINTTGNYKPGDIIGRMGDDDDTPDTYMDRVYVGEGNGLFGSNYVPKLVRPQAVEEEEVEEVEEVEEIKPPTSGGGGGFTPFPTNPGGGGSTNVNVDSSASVDNSTTGTIGNDNVIGDNFTFNNNNAVTDIDQGVSISEQFVNDRMNNYNIKREAEVDNSVLTSIGDRNVIGDNAYIGNNDSVTNIDQTFDLSLGDFGGSTSSSGNRDLARQRAGGWLNSNSPLNYFNQRG